MNYFEHNERRKPAPPKPDMLRPDFEPPRFSIHGGMVVEPYVCPRGPNCQGCYGAVPDCKTPR